MVNELVLFPAQNVESKSKNLTKNFKDFVAVNKLNLSMVIVFADYSDIDLNLSTNTAVRRANLCTFGS